MARILIVDDEPPVVIMLRRLLTRAGHQCDDADNGRRAIERLADEDYDLMILDLRMPVMDGFDVLDQLRERGIRIRVLVLSVMDDTDGKVRALRSGADEYVVKPCPNEELLARVDTLLRLPEPSREPESSAILRFPGLVVDPVAREVLVDEEPVDFARHEFDLLWALARNAGRAMSRDALRLEAWGDRSDIKTRTVDYHVSQIRRKIGDDADNPRHIITIRSFGYRFDP